VSFLHRAKAFVGAMGIAFLLAACGARQVARTEGHLQPEPPRPPSTIPEPVRAVPLPPPPEARDTELRYSVVVANQPVREVLLAMARETRINFDIHPGIEGTVNLNAIDQTLKQILTRISRQVDMRWEQDGQTITVMPDTPFLRSYKVNYVNMSRDVSGTIGVQSQVVGAPSAGGGAQSASYASSSQNSSLLKIDNLGKNRFWESLEKNIKDLLRETDKQLPEGSSETYVASRGQGATSTSQSRLTARRDGTQTRTQTGATVESPGGSTSQDAREVLESRLTFREAASVIVNAETGVVTVRATSRQHEKVAEFLALAAGSARRQVLIEATVVEVLLNDTYQTGVDWSALGINGLGYSLRQNFLGNNMAQQPFFSVTYSNPNAAAGGSISSTVKLLDTYGTTHVLSSPKLMVINNQTAVLKVVENKVYFSVQAQIAAGTLGTNPLIAYTTTQNVVPVGFVMNVTAQIGDDDVVVLNVRPSVSSIIGYVNDPNPDLAKAGVISQVPEIQSREFESVMRVPSGATAILGGLMQDRTETQRDGLPVLSRIPFFGDAVSYRKDVTRKNELVVFLRPIVVRDPSVEGDLAAYRRYLPSSEFFREAKPTLPELEKQLERIEYGLPPEPNGTKQ
jgi:general secretion pathway protein D